jgi:Transcriptional repressor TCF25
MNVLLTLDYHTIVVGRDCGYSEQIDLLRWLVDLVDLDLIRVWYRDKGESSSTSHRCSLLDLPNWAYSYALALFDLQNAIKHGGNDIEFMDSFENMKCKADAAIKWAISRYPAVVGSLLHNLEIDTSGRSFHRDWLPVLEKLSVSEHELFSEWHSTSQYSLVLSETLQTRDLLTKIYVQQTARLYADDIIVQWMYENTVDLLSIEEFLLPDPPNPAILRYASADPTDFDLEVQMLPPDANAVEVGLLAHAMVINPNRPRYLRRQNRRDDEHDEDDFHVGVFGNRTQHPRYFGPPSEMVDPDWPMLEVFWRSLLPWNHVEGMPPPR